MRTATEPAASSLARRVGAARASAEVAAWLRPGWLCFVAAFCYAILLGGSWAGLYSVGLRIVSLLAVTVALAVWLGLAIRRPWLRPRSAIWPALVAMIGALAMGTLTSTDPRLGVEYLAWAVLLVAAYLLLVRVLAQPSAGRRVGWLAAILGLGIGVTYACVVGVAWVDWWALVGQPAVPPLRPDFAGLAWGNPSAVMTIMVLLTVISLAGLGFDEGRSRLVNGLLTALTAAVVLISGSRAGWLALGVALVLVGVAWLVVGDNREVLARALRDRAARRAVPAAAAICGLALLALAPAIAFRASATGDGGRLTYFATAMRMFWDRPLVGQGVGMWAPLRLSRTMPGEVDYYVPHAHDVYLQTLAEMGLVGLVAAIVVIASVCWLLGRGILDVDPMRRRWAWMGVLGIVYLGLHQLLDSYANMVAVMLLAVVPIAWLDATSPRTLSLPGLGTSARRVFARVGGAALVVGCAVAAAVLLRVESVAVTHQLAVDRVEQGDWRSALPLAVEAAANDPEMTPYQVTLGLTATEAGDWATAAAAYERAARADDLPESWLGLAYAQVGLGRASDVVAASLRSALRMGSGQPAVVYAVATLYERMGMTDEADDAFVQALAKVPSLAADPSWSSARELRSRFPSIVQRAGELAPGEAWELALMRGLTSEALRLAWTAPDPRLALAVVRAWSGDPKAVDALASFALARGMDPVGFAWAARVSERVGRHADAERFRRLVDLVQDGDEIRPYEMRVLVGRPRIDPSAGTLTSHYGTYLYRRPTPQDLIPPGLPRLTPAEGISALDWRPR